MNQVRNMRLILSIIIAGCLSACNNNDEPSNIPSDVCYDFVTLASNSEGSTYTLRQGPDTELITYQSSYQIPSSAEIEVGTRLIIMYLPPNNIPYKSGPITLYGYKKLNNTEQNIVLTDAEGVSLRKSNDIKVVSLNRTGKYINLQANFQCQGSTPPKKLILTVDSLKLDAEYPELNIIYEAQQDGLNYYGGYASFDISKVWDLSTCQGIKINYMTGQGEASTTFKKTHSFLPTE